MARNNKPQNNKPQPNVKPQNSQSPQNNRPTNNQTSRPQAQQNNKQSSTNNSMKIDRSDVINNPGKYDNGYNRDVAAQNPSSVIYQGLYGGGLSDGEGGTHKLQGFHVPGAGNGIGPAGDVLFAAGPNANQEWLNANFGVGGRYYKAPSAEQTAAAGSSSTSEQKKYGSVKDAIKSGDRLSMGQILKIAAGSGNGTDLVDKREFNKIHKYLNGNKSGLDILGRMDKMNSKQAGKENGFNPMGVQSDVYNRINKDKYGDGMDLAIRRTGAASLNPDYIYDKYGSLSGLASRYKGSNIDGIKGFGVYGVDADGKAILSAGQGGRSWSSNKWIGATSGSGTGTGTGTGDGTGTGTGTGTDDGSNVDPGFGVDPPSGINSGATGGYSTNIDNNNLGYHRKKSSWAASGRNRKGASIAGRSNFASGFSY